MLCMDLIHTTQILLRRTRGKSAYREYFESILENIESYQDFDVYGHLDYVVRYGPTSMKIMTGGNIRMWSMKFYENLSPRKRNRVKHRRFQIRSWSPESNRGDYKALPRTWRRDHHDWCWRPQTGTCCIWFCKSSFYIKRFWLWLLYGVPGKKTGVCEDWIEKVAV